MQLHLRPELLADAFDHTPVGLVAFDSFGVAHANAVARQVLGGPVDQIWFPRPARPGLRRITGPDGRVVAANAARARTGWVVQVTLEEAPVSAPTPDPMPSTVPLGLLAEGALATLGDLVHGDADPDQIAQAAVDLVGTHLGADRAGLMELDEHGGRLLAAWGTWPTSGPSTDITQAASWMTAVVPGPSATPRIAVVASDTGGAFDEAAADFLHAVAQVIGATATVPAPQIQASAPPRRSPAPLPDREWLLSEAEDALEHHDHDQERLGFAIVEFAGLGHISAAEGHLSADAELEGLAKALGSALGDELPALVARVSASDLGVLYEAPSAAALIDRLGRALERLAAGDGSVVDAAAGLVVTDDTMQPDAVEGILRDAAAARLAARGGSPRRGLQRGARHAGQGGARAAAPPRRGRHRRPDHPALPARHRSANRARAGAEALARWQHPELGLIGPAAFIAAAESTGRIRQVGAAVLARAVADLAEWRRDGVVDEDFTLGINVAPVQLERPEVVEQVAAQLELHGLSPENLCIEITESTLLSSEPMALDNVERLRALGVKVAIDDFGTGYSSLAQLRRLPVTTLKLDRSFVIDLDLDPLALALASGVLSIARGLDLDIVAEGAERQAQADLLRDRGCDRVQGFLWSEPIDAATFRTWMLRHRRGLEVAP